MNYYDIARQNQALFAELEALTLEISYSIANNIENDVDYLQHQKKRICELINMNLDKIEEIWAVNILSYRRAIRTEREVATTALQKKIIGLFIDNPGQSQKWIADNVGVTLGWVSKTITGYLNLKYDKTELWPEKDI